MIEYETQLIEQNIIGQVLKNPESMSEVGVIITAEDFFHLDHRNIFGAVEALYENKTPVTVVSVYTLLTRRNQPINADYLQELLTNTATTKAIVSYAKSLADSSKRLKIYQAAAQIMREYDEPGTAEDKLDSAQSLLMAVGATKSANVYDMTTVMKNVVGELERRFESDGELLGLSSGFIDVDARINGYRDANLVIIAARPAMGKTTYALNMAEREAIRGGRPLIFSLEMSKEELGERTIASLGSIPAELVRSGQVMAHDDHAHKMFANIKSMMETSMRIVDKPAISISELKSISRREHRAQPLTMIMVDYMQLMTAKGENRQGEIAAIVGGLKAIAKELCIPVVALSQLNRSLEARADKRPIMSDLRESGAIEQDADIIHFLYRDIVYNPDTPNPHVTEVITAKFRSGAMGTDYLKSELHMNRFADFTGDFVEDTPQLKAVPSYRS